PLWFFGFLSEYSVAPGAQGSISFWNQSLYVGKQLGASAPYFLFGGGVTSVQWKNDSRSLNGTDPELLGELGWPGNLTTALVCVLEFVLSVH
ncbi:hypothetical protein LEP1GSC158_3475, partial [Leptospira interrogans serovar Zanoni str. LT2156]